MKIVRRFGQAWQVLGLPFWIKPFVGRLSERDQPFRWLTIVLDEDGAWIDVWRFTCGVTIGAIQRRKK